MMIYVEYLYFRKKTNSWEEDTKTFNDVFKACRFIKKCRYGNGYILKSFRCDDHEDYDYLIMKGC